MQWWQDRTGRERLLIAGAGGLCAILALYQFVYVPVLAYRDSAYRSYLQAEALMQDVAAGAAQANALKQVTARRSASDEPLRVTVTTSAHRAGVSITRLEPDANGGLSVWVEEADARVIQGWIADLQGDHGITVEKATIRRHDGKPMVRAQILFAGVGAS